MPPSATGRIRTSRTASVVLMLGVHALLLLIPSPAGAQAQAECATSDCPDQRLQAPPAQRQLWLDAAAAHQLKLRFVEALQRFTRAQAGTFGDEGADLRPSVDAMREALVRWDTAIREFQTRATRLAAGAEVHVALATVFLDRQRVADALHELDAASRDDNRASTCTRCVPSPTRCRTVLRTQPGRSARQLRSTPTIPRCSTPSRSTRQEPIVRRRRKRPCAGFFARCACAVQPEHALRTLRRSNASIC